MHTEGVHICHAENDGEVRIENFMLTVTKV